MLAVQRLSRHALRSGAVWLALLLQSVWIFVPIRGEAEAFSQEGPYAIIQPLTLQSLDGPHWEYDLVLEYEFVAAKPRWRVVQGPEMSLVFDPDQDSDLTPPYGFAGPALGGTRMMDPELSVLFPYPIADPFTPGMPYSSWMGEGTIDSLTVTLEPGEGRVEFEGYPAYEYHLEVEVSMTRLTGDAEIELLTDLLMGKLWVLPDLPFTDAVFLPYFHPFDIGPAEVAFHLQNELTSQLGGLGLLAVADVTFYGGLDDDDLPRVRQGERPQSVWPQRTISTVENLRQVGAPDYSRLAQDLSLIDAVGYDRLLSTLVLFDVWVPCLPLPIAEIDAAMLSVTGRVSGMPSGQTTVIGDAMHGSNAAPEAFGIHVTGHIEGDMTLCLALLRVGAGSPEPGTYRILPPAAQFSSERVGDFVGFLVGVEGDDPYDMRTLRTVMAFETFAGELTIEEVGMTRDAVDGEWISGHLHLSAIGVRLDELYDTQHLELTAEFESWGGLRGAPTAQ